MRRMCSLLTLYKFDQQLFVAATHVEKQQGQAEACCLLVQFFTVGSLSDAVQPAQLKQYQHATCNTTFISVSEAQ